MKRSAHSFVRRLAVLALAGATGAAWPQTTAGTPPPPAGVVQPVDAAPAPATASQPTDKLVTGFSGFSGSPENAASLVNGLRTGTPITLSGPTGSGGVGEVLTFSAPTRPMGYGNIRIALSLAKAQLASQGIGDPTPTELQGALLGKTIVASDGSVTTTQGVLQMRAAGMGWGKIANTMGFKLGAVMSGKQSFAAATAATTHAPRTTGALGSASPGTGKSRITTAGGGSVNAGSHGKSQVVTAAGGAGGRVSTGLGQGGQGSHGHGAGVSSGVVSAAGGNAAAGAQGAARGNAHGKP